MNPRVFRASGNSGFLTIVFGATALVLFVVGLRSALERGAILMLLALPAAGVALLSYLQFRNGRLEIDEEGLKSYDFTGGLLLLRWADIESLVIDSSDGELSPRLVFQTKYGVYRAQPSRGVRIEAGT